MNALRGEWKTQVEVGHSDYLTTQWYQPLDYAGRFFVMPAAGIQRQPFNLFIDETAIGRYLVDDVFVGLQGGISFGPYGQLTAGIRRDWYNFKENISAFPVPDTTVNQTAFVSQLNLDQLDDVAFPRSGWAGERAVHLGRKRPRGRQLVQPAHGRRRLGDEQGGLDAPARRQRRDEDREQLRSRSSRRASSAAS